LEELRSLPSDLTTEGGSIVQRHGSNAAQQIRSNYQSHWHTGNLAGSVVTEFQDTGRFGVALVVRARAKHAHIFEYGTVARSTGQGAFRGVMPPAPPLHAFVPVMEQERRATYEDLAALLEDKGLEATNRA
jgi:hypothetical protein